MNVSWQMFETCFGSVYHIFENWVLYPDVAQSRHFLSQGAVGTRLSQLCCCVFPVLLPDTPTCRCKKQLVHVKTSVSASLTRYVHTHKSYISACQKHVVQRCAHAVMMQVSCACRCVVCFVMEVARTMLT